MFTLTARRRGRIACSAVADRSYRALWLEALEDRQLFTLEGNALFPADNPWNQRVDTAPVAANSAALVASIGSASVLHPDFGTIYAGAYIGIPYNVVDGTQPTVNVVIDAYADQSDIVPVPIPTAALIEGDPLPSNANHGDRHLLVYDRDNNISYELFNVHRPSETTDSQWHADSEAVWHMDQNWFRPADWTSADAAGLPILPGLVRPDEVLDQGVIDHALRFTVPNSRDQYIYPASHEAGTSNVNFPRMGERFRLKASFDISGFSPANQVILQALKTYGMIVADNGSGWYLSGSPSSRWDDDDLHNLTSIFGSAFEAVDLTPIVTSVAPNASPLPTTVTIHGQNFSGAAGEVNVLFGTTPGTSVNVISDTTLTVTSPNLAPGTYNVTVQTPYGSSAASTGSSFTFTTEENTTILGRRLFYNQSGTAAPLRYDGNNAAINASDDLAIASDKMAYLPGSGAATFANVSSYSRGINGIMIDLVGAHGNITASDFSFRVGNNNAPSSWAAAPAPVSISVRSGAGVSGSDRIEIVWANGAIQNQWLEVIVKATANTNLAQKAGYPTGQADVFFFGHALADTGLGDTATQANVSATDVLAIRNNPANVLANVPITNLFDINRDARVDSTDVLLARNHPTSLSNVVRFITIGSPPSAPESAPIVASLVAPPPGSRLVPEQPVRRADEVLRFPAAAGLQRAIDSLFIQWPNDWNDLELPPDNGPLPHDPPAASAPNLRDARTFGRPIGF